MPPAAELTSHGLRDLHAAARAWVARCDEAQQRVRDQAARRAARAEARKPKRSKAAKEKEKEVWPPETGAYVDLIFAFGFARLGDREAAAELSRLAGERLNHGNPVHTLLYSGFTHRIRQVVEGAEPRGSWLRDADGLPLIQAYMVDRLRAHSRILEPEEHVDPYRAAPLPSKKAAKGLRNVEDDVQLAAQIDDLLREVTKAKEQGLPQRLQLLSEACALARTRSDAFFTFAFDLVKPHLGRLATERETEIMQLTVELFSRALLAAAARGQTEWVLTLFGHTRELLKSHPHRLELQAMIPVVAQGLRSLCHVDRKQEALLLADEASALALAATGNDGTGEFLKRAQMGEESLLPLFVHLAAAQYAGGARDRAEPVLTVAHHLLTPGGIFHGLPVDAANLACALASVLAWMPAQAAFQKGRQFFANLTEIRDAFTTGGHFGRLQFQIVETALLGVIHAAKPDAVARLHLL